MKTIQLFTLVLLTFSFFSYSQDGTIDLSFGEEGIAITNFNDEQSFITGVGQLSNNNIVVVGKIRIEAILQTVLVKYFPSGELDLSFGDDGVLLLNYNTSNNKTPIIIQNDDKIIIASQPNGTNENYIKIARYMQNGELDPSFGNNGFVETEISDLNGFSRLLLQPNGKIILFGANNTNEKIYIARFLPNGLLDDTFGENGIAIYFSNINLGSWNSFQLKNDGKIIILINIDYQGNEVMFLQYLPNGELDASFGDNGILLLDTSGYFIYKNAFTVKENGSIVVVSGEQSKTIIMRLLSNGAIDTTYGDNGKTELLFDALRPEELFVNTDNKLLIYSQTWDNQGESSTFELIRVDENGVLDNSFGENGSITTGIESSDVILQNDGKILGVGNTYWFWGGEDFMLVRYHNNGSLGVTEQNENEMIIYPNPSNGIFKVNHDFISSDIQYQITDITGKIIQIGKLSGEQTEINLINVTSGIYFFKASNNILKLLKK